MNPIKRSVTIRGHRTSVSLEEIFWVELHQEAHERGVTLAALIDDIDRIRVERGMLSGLSGALRVHVAQRLKEAQTPSQD